MYNSQKLIIVFVILLSQGLFLSDSFAQKFADISNATIYTPKQHKAEFKKIVQVLQEEVQKRSGIVWAKSKKLDKSNKTQIIIAFEQGKNTLPEGWLKASNTLEKIGPDGYQLIVLPEVNKVLVLSKNKRGALYGVGKLLRKMEIRKDEVLVPAGLQISSTPAYEIRGHQLGYRPKTNSYDAWSVPQFDQYIRELAIFGANSIEIMPPRTDDDFTSRHMQLPAIEMIEAQSKICDDYDLDVWMWYPNLGSDYTSKEAVKVELEERREVFAKVPRLDHLFVPGGDPGDLEPDVLFNWLKTVAIELRKYHPNAKIWISPQVFRPTQEWFDKFYTYINEEPDWLGGVVFGPWVKPTLEEIRSRINANILIRRYPDITHSLSSQYPIPKWDLAQTITLGRECINPRPTDEKIIHNALDQLANGSLSYSEGTNDDVNKFIWSDQDWNPETSVIETLRDYTRFFISPDHTEDIAQGLMMLEKNIQGPLLINEKVEQTLWQWQEIEAIATDAMKSNYRYQMGLIRAYFDAYVQKRLVYETNLERQARAQLSDANKIGAEKAVTLCRETLALAWKNKIEPAYRQKCMDLADELFSSIGAQLTIEKHGAMGGRGNFIDNIDNPLNDVAWILSELKKVEKLTTEEAKLMAIDIMLKRNNPGTGGFYDNFGNPQSWNRVIVDKTYSEDPGSLSSPRVSFGVGLKDREWVHEITAKGFEGDAAPMSWMNQVTTLYDEPLQIHYDNLNAEASYLIKVAYTGRFRSRMKMMADGLPVHDFIKTGVQPIYEFPIPKEALKDGKVTFTWTCGEGERGSQVSEIWIIKNNK